MRKNETVFDIYESKVFTNDEKNRLMVLIPAIYYLMNQNLTDKARFFYMSTVYKGWVEFKNDATETALEQATQFIKLENFDLESFADEFKSAHKEVLVGYGVVGGILKNAIEEKTPEENLAALTQGEKDALVFHLTKFKERLPFLIGFVSQHLDIDSQTAFTMKEGAVITNQAMFNNMQNLVDNYLPVLLQDQNSQLLSDQTSGLSSSTLTSPQQEKEEKELFADPSVGMSDNLDEVLKAIDEVYEAVGKGIPQEENIQTLLNLVDECASVDGDQKYVVTELVKNADPGQQYRALKALFWLNKHTQYFNNKADSDNYLKLPENLTLDPKLLEVNKEEKNYQFFVELSKHFFRTPSSFNEAVKEARKELDSIHAALNKADKTPDELDSIPSDLEKMFEKVYLLHFAYYGMNEEAQKKSDKSTYEVLRAYLNQREVLAVYLPQDKYSPVLYTHGFENETEKPQDVTAGDAKAKAILNAKANKAKSLVFVPVKAKEEKGSFISMPSFGSFVSKKPPVELTEEQKVQQAYDAAFKALQQAVKDQIKPSKTTKEQSTKLVNLLGKYISFSGMTAPVDYELPEGALDKVFEDAERVLSNGFRTAMSGIHKEMFIRSTDSVRVFHAAAVSTKSKEVLENNYELTMCAYFYNNRYQDLFSIFPDSKNKKSDFSENAVNAVWWVYFVATFVASEGKFEFISNLVKSEDPETSEPHDSYLVTLQRAQAILRYFDDVLVNLPMVPGTLISPKSKPHPDQETFKEEAFKSLIYLDSQLWEDKEFMRKIFTPKDVAQPNQSKTKQPVSTSSFSTGGLSSSVASQELNFTDDEINKINALSLQDLMTEVADILNSKERVGKKAEVAFAIKAIVFLSHMGDKLPQEGWISTLKGKQRKMPWVTQDGKGILNKSAVRIMELPVLLTYFSDACTGTVAEGEDRRFPPPAEFFELAGVGPDQFKEVIDDQDEVSYSIMLKNDDGKNAPFYFMHMPQNSINAYEKHFALASSKAPVPFRFMPTTTIVLFLKEAKDAYIEGEQQKAFGLLEGIVKEHARLDKAYTSFVDANDQKAADFQMTLIEAFLTHDLDFRSALQARYPSNTFPALKTGGVLDFEKARLYLDAQQPGLAIPQQELKNEGDLPDPEDIFNPNSQGLQSKSETKSDSHSDNLNILMPKPSVSEVPESGDLNNQDNGKGKGKQNDDEEQDIFDFN